MPTQTELDVLAVFRDAKVESRPIHIRDRVPFQENYIEMLMRSLERESLLEYDEERDCMVISQKGLEVANRSRPRQPEEELSQGPPRKTPGIWRYSNRRIADAHVERDETHPHEPKRQELPRHCAGHGSIQYVTP
jgi:hypothetical protein